MGARRIIWILVLALSFLVGCGLSQELKSWEEAIKEPVEEIDDSMVKDVTSKSDSGDITILLYFKQKNQLTLGVETRQIEKVEGIARRTIEELLRGPNDQDLESAVPAGTRLLDINIKPDGSCIVDFNETITQVEGGKKATLAVYSIVNTISQFPTVDHITFLVNGERIDTLGGMDVSQPVVADFELFQ